VEKVSASTAIERGSVGFESTDKVQRVTKAASKANKQEKGSKRGILPPPKRRGLVGWLLLQKSASGIDEQADGSKVLCSWRVVGTASLLEN
jgi:hypothetical protein